MGEMGGGGGRVGLTNRKRNIDFAKKAEKLLVVDSQAFEAVNQKVEDPQVTVLCIGSNKVAWRVKKMEG
jgi:hypothetical protein